MASQSNTGMWIGAAPSENSTPRNLALKLEEDPSWKAPASSPNTTNMDVKGNVNGTPNFKFPGLECKEVLEQEWYTPETSLMELSTYSSSPYGISDTRSGFGLLDASLNFDSTSNLISSFRSAPSTLGMDDLQCTGQGSSVGLLSSISPGGPISRSTPMDSFSSGLPTLSFNQRITNQGGSPSNITNSNDGPRNELKPHHKRKEINSNLQEQQSAIPKRAPSNRTITPESKSPPQVTTSASNDSSVGAPEKGSPRPQNDHIQNASGRTDLHSGSDDPNENAGVDGEDDDGKDDDDMDESGDGSGGPYEVGEGDGGVNHSKGAKGKRGLPAKNLMAERRRRKKLNDRLYMLRSVVPKITKMDRASILGDAIEYLKELLQRINDIHKELEEAKLEQSRSLPTSPVAGRTSWPTPGYSTAVKEQCPVLPNPESQPPRVEVRKREGQALNIHMFCARRPGLLLNTVRALDALGLDVQQAVISCFNGFALDLFRAEARNGDVAPDEIKAVLLLTAGCGMHPLQ
ncbi:hypothetical protein M758_6G187400 [Ceratodon purpureus]|nr:hypothetical protein M758_6G187400 [Ceratodon purpureus]